LVDSHFANAAPHQVNLTETAAGGAYGRNPPIPYRTCPPFNSLAWIIFKGYS
jgi:hypothetical protein